MALQDTFTSGLIFTIALQKNKIYLTAYTWKFWKLSRRIGLAFSNGDLLCFSFILATGLSLMDTQITWSFHSKCLPHDTAKEKLWIQEGKGWGEMQSQGIPSHYLSKAWKIGSFVAMSPRISLPYLLCLHHYNVFQKKLPFLDFKWDDS